MQHYKMPSLFPVVMHGCESWTVKKAECRRTDSFELWCWRRVLRVPWTARRSNQSILKEISPGCSLEGLMLKLKLQYFGHLMWSAYSLEKDPDPGKDWGQEEKGTTEDEMVGWYHQFNGHAFGWTPGVGDTQWGLGCCGSWSCKELDTTERLNWTELPCLTNKVLTLIFNTLCDWVPTVVSATTLTSHFHYFFNHIMYIYIQISCGLKLLLIVTLEH